MTPARLTRAGARRKDSDWQRDPMRSRASNAHETRVETRVSAKLSGDAASDSTAGVRASPRASRKRSRDVSIESTLSVVKSLRPCEAILEDEDESDVVATVRAADGGNDATSTVRREIPVESPVAYTPRTRRETKDYACRKANEAHSALLGTLCEDALWKVCEFLPAKDLASLECASSYFHRPMRRSDRGLGIVERVARVRIRSALMADMPPLYR